MKGNLPKLRAPLPWVIANTICLILFGSWPAHAADRVLKYEDLPNLIRQKNEGVQASAEMVNANQVRTGFLKRSFFPQVEINGGAQHFKTRDFPQTTQPFGGAGVSLNLYRGGRDQLAEEGRQAEVGIAKADQEMTFRQELLLARKLFWELAYQQEWVSAVKQVLQINSKSRGAAALLVSKGLTTDTDLLGFDLFQSQANEMIASANHDSEIIEDQLRTRLGMSPGTPIKISTPIPHSHDEDLVNTDLSVATHPEVQVLREEIKKDRAIGKRFSRQWTPEIDAVGLYQLYTERDRDLLGIKERQDLAGGLLLKMHVFDGFQAKHEAQSARQRAISKGMLAQYKEKVLRTDLKTNREEMKHFHRLIHASEGFLKKGGQWLDKTMEDYSLGLKTSQEVLDVVERMLELKKQNLNYRRDYQLHKVALLGLLGD